MDAKDWKIFFKTKTGKKVMKAILDECHKDTNELENFKPMTMAEIKKLKPFTI